MNGNPVVCGGARDCFQYQKDTKKWQKVTKLEYQDLNFIFMKFKKVCFSFGLDQ
jgi:hypothetical protein